ncbi:hypothetical protein B0H11DRAFT_2248177 [Mycena galericulata]|nr:hypothetical protein B0H11DRAFT_2248177 [Mycena galericulata]
MSTDACTLCNQSHGPEDQCDGGNSIIPDFQHYSWGIITTPTLRSYSIGINREISLFTCLTCESAYTTENVSTHLRHHNIRFTAELKREIEQIGACASLEAVYPSWAVEGLPEPRPQIAGILLKKDLSGCPTCTYTAVHDKVMNHMKKKNHGTGKPLEGMFAQVLNNGATKTNIRVTPRLEPERRSQGPVPEFFAEFKKFDWRAHRRTELPNARLISPWLMRTRWHEQILPYRSHSAELLQRVAMPSSNEQLPRGLHEAVIKYFQDATKKLDHTNELVLQLLNSRNPDKDGVNNTPLHAHHQKDKTLKTYATVTTHLLAALLRPSTHYTFPSSADLTTALAAFMAVRENTDVQPALHSVLMALWKTNWPSDREQHFPDPTMSFLMLFSLKEGGEFAQPKETTGPLSKLCWAIQLAMVHEIHRLVESAEAPTQMDAWEMVAPFVVEKKMTTFHSLMSLQHYATTLVFQSIALPRIWWLDRDKWQEMLYDGHKITLTQLGEIFDALEKKIIDLWENEVLLGLGLHVKYDDLADDLSQTRNGYSFLDNPSNPFAALDQAFPNAILENPDLLAKFITVDADGNQHANVLLCRKWLMSLAQLEGLLMLAIEMISGAPPRSTELVSMLARNTETRTSNLRALGHFVAIIRQYDKTSNHYQRDRLIPHALSAVNADILIQLHTFARPWARYLAKFVFPNNPTVIAQYGEMLFMDFGKEFTSDKLSSLMAQWSGKTLGWEMTTNPFRHINIAFRRKLCVGPDSIEAIEGDATSTINALQAGHSPVTEDTVYGLSPEALFGASEDVLYLYLKTSRNWQKVVRVVPGGLALPFKDATREKFDSLVIQGIIKTKSSAVGPVSNVPIDATFEQMFGDFQQKSTKRDAMIVAQLDQALQAMADLRAEVDSLRRDIRGGAPPAAAAPLRQLTVTAALELEQPCTELHITSPAPDTEQSRAELHIASPVRPAPVPASQSQRKDLHIANPVRPAPVPASQSQRKDLLVCLKRLYGAQADWRDPQQYNAVKEVLALRRDIIVASKTGAGKTPVAILPTMVEQGYTVIVLPLLALMEDWIRRLDKFNIGYERFLGAKGPETLSGQHNLILVSSDIAKTDRWRKAITQLHNGPKPVLRIIVDEVGYYVFDNGFREDAFIHPFRLRQFPCQLVLMSATISPAAEKYLIEQFMLANVLRFSTTCYRSEIHWEIWPKCQKFQEQVDAAKDIIKTTLGTKSKWKPHHRFLVFVLSHKEGKAVAKDLKLPFYHAHSDDHPISDEARQKIYHDWLEGVTLGIVATTALGAGNDYPHVMFTIHIGAPWNLATFVQQGGRAGRDGHHAINWVIPHKSARLVKKVDPKYGDMLGAQAMQDIIYHNATKPYPESCIIYAVTAFLDGKGKTCRALNHQLLCQGCSKQSDNRLAELVPSQTKSNHLPKNQPLPWNRPTDLKRKLTDAFGVVAQEAHKRQRALIEKKYDKLQVFRDLFDLVGQTCGYCFAHGVQLPEADHKWKDCPNIDGTPHHRKIRDFQYAIHYDKEKGKNLPCFHCHIASMGRNTLHPEFATGEVTCTHLNLTIPLAYAIYANPELHHHAKAYFNPRANHKDWNSIQQYAEWFSTPHPEFGWQSMALLKWASEYFIEGDSHDT